MPFDVYQRYRKGELESRPMGTSKKFGSLMSGGQGQGQGAGAPSATDAQPSAPAGAAAPGPSATGPTAGGAATRGHGEGISVLSAEDDTAQTRAAVVVESSGVVAPSTGGPADAPSNDMPFEQVVRLIQEGRAHEVPRKEIPEGLNVEPASASTMAPRRKPWEAAGSGAAPADPVTQGESAQAPAPQQ